MHPTTLYFWRLEKRKTALLLRFCLSWFLLFTSGCFSMAQQGAMQRAYSAISSQKYQEALHALAHAQHYKEPTEGLRAEISYLRGVCYSGLGKNMDANAMFRYVWDHFPDTEFGYKAKERLAQSSIDEEPFISHGVERDVERSILAAENLTNQPKGLSLGNGQPSTFRPLIVHKAHLQKVPGAGLWKERWTVRRFDQDVIYEITFTRGSDGTTYFSISNPVSKSR